MQVLPAACFFLGVTAVGEERPLRQDMSSAAMALSSEQSGSPGTHSSGRLGLRDDFNEA